MSVSWALDVRPHLFSPSIFLFRWRVFLTRSTIISKLSFKVNFETSKSVMHISSLYLEDTAKVGEMPPWQLL
jgi:hypothetical protein